MQLTNIQQTVIVPFDFSEMSIQAIQKAIEMVEDPSLIQVLHVTEYPSAYEYGVVWETITEDTIVQKLSESFAERMGKIEEMPELRFEIRFGNPGREICKYAKEIDCGLIVMPSHGRSGVVRFLLGSVAERVVRCASCPVLIVRNEQDNQDIESEGISSLANVLI